MNLPRQLPEHRNGRTRPPNGYQDANAAVFVEGVQIKEIFGVIRRHFRLVVVAAVLAVSAAVYLTPKPGPTYTTGAAIQIVNARRSLAVGIEDMGSDRLGRFVDPVQSHIEMLRGRTVVGRVVDREGLRLSSLTEGFPLSRLQTASVDSAAARDTLLLEFSDDAVKVSTRTDSATSDYGSPVELGGVRFTMATPPEVREASIVVGSRDGAIDRLIGGIRAAPRRETDIIDVYFTSPSPHTAQRVVNALVEEHHRWSVEFAQDRSRRRRLFLEEQLASADGRLSDAQVALSVFRGRSEVYNSRERLSAEQRALMELHVRIEELTAERRLYESLLGDLRTTESFDGNRLRALVSAPGIAGNPVISQLYAQLVRYETARDTLVTGSIGRTASHPDVERLNGLIGSTQAAILEAADTHLRLLNERVSALGDFRSRSSANLRVLPAAEAEEMRLTQRVESYRAISDQLRSELQKAEMAEAVEAGQVEIVYLAPPPTAPSAPSRRKRNALLAGALGLMLGMGGAFGREMLNTSIKRRLELRTSLNLPELAVIPRINGTRGRKGWHRVLPSRTETRDALTGATNPYTASADAYRTLRTNLTLNPAERRLKSIVVTSAAPKEGKSTTAANLAYVCAQQGKRVVLVDADLRRPRLHEVLDTELKPGLTCMLRGSSTPATAVHPTGIKGLSLIPSGSLATNPSELLSSQRMHELLIGLTQHFDMVIIDSPPLLAATDAAILAAEVDGVILVVRAGRTERGAAQEALQQLAAVGAHIAGAVLNDPDAELPKYGEYYHAYGYYAEQNV